MPQQPPSPQVPSMRAPTGRERAINAFLSLMQELGKQPLMQALGILGDATTPRGSQRPEDAAFLQQLAGHPVDMRLGAMPQMPGKAYPAYHGTTAAIDGPLSVNKSGGAWSASRPEVAEMYAAALSPYAVEDVYPRTMYGTRGGGVKAIRVNQYAPGANIVPVRVTLKNPKILSNAEGRRLLESTGDVRDGGEVFDALSKQWRAEGYDGAIIRGNPQSPLLELRATNYVSFEPGATVPSIPLRTNAPKPAGQK